MPDWHSDHNLKPQSQDMAGQWRIAPMPTWDDGNSHKTTVFEDRTGFNTVFGLGQSARELFLEVHVLV